MEKVSSMEVRKLQCVWIWGNNVRITLTGTHVLTFVRISDHVIPRSWIKLVKYERFGSILEEMKMKFISISNLSREQCEKIINDSTFEYKKEAIKIMDSKHFFGDRVQYMFVDRRVCIWRWENREVIFNNQGTLSLFIRDFLGKGD
jgi:hypothetical protein